MKKCLFISFNFSKALTLFLVFVLVFSLILSFGFATTPTVSDAIDCSNTVIIDAGHGGEDGGTQSSAGVLEKDINLNITMKLGTLLRLMGYTVVYTRTEDKLYYGDDAVTQRQKKVSDIHYRMKLMEAYNNALFISIHQNYFEQSKYYGAQVFYSKNNPESQIIAEKIQSNIKSGTDIYLLYHTKSPAVMVECGFMSNPGEALLLSDDKYQIKLCLAIAAGLEEYI